MINSGIKFERDLGAQLPAVAESDGCVRSVERRGDVTLLLLSVDRAADLLARSLACVQNRNGVVDF
jgi:hypothetical protein